MRILLTRRAEIDFVEIKKYIKNKFGDKTSLQFEQKVSDLFGLLKVYPSLGQIEIKDVRGFQLSHQTRILYRVKNENIIILASLTFDKNRKRRKYNFETNSICK
jgi:plasmid stabilization system protein ParE